MIRIISVYDDVSTTLVSIIPKGLINSWHLKEYVKEENQMTISKYSSGYDELMKDVWDSTARFALKKHKENPEALLSVVALNIYFENRMY